MTPLTSYLALRRLGRLPVADAAGIAAHDGSVSAVTFIAAIGFATAQGTVPEGFMPTLVTLLESPGINIALAVGLMASGGGRSLAAAAHEMTLSLACALGVTFPFNLLVGIPLYHHFARHLAGE